MTSNDNDAVQRRTTETCAHGHAALLLVESLVHGLCERSVLSVDDAVEIAERAVSVQFDLVEMTDAVDGAKTSMWRTHALLSSIAASLSTDDRSSPPFPQLVP